MGAMGLASSIGGLFSRDTGNPNEMFKDPNNPFYTTATKNYYNNLSKTLGANTPGKATLLAMQSASGGGYGGSAYVAGKQNESMLAKNRDVAASASGQFQDNLFTKGMSLVSEGNIAQYQDRNSFSDNLMTLGGGLFSRFFNQDNPFGISGDVTGGGTGGNPIPNTNNQISPPAHVRGYNPSPFYGGS